MPGPWEKYKSSADGPWAKFSSKENKLGTTSEGESLLRGAAQGATFGFADEIAGAYDTAKKTAFGDKKFSELPSTYREERDLSRALHEKAAQDNPGLYTAGEIGGGIASSFVPGGAALNAAKGAKLGTQLIKAGTTGALAGLGSSSADLTKGEVGKALEDTVTGGMTGVTTQGALSGLGKVANTVTPKNFAKGAAKIVLGTPTEVTETYIKNPQAVKNAPTRFEMSKAYQDTLESLGKEARSGSKAAREKLKAEGVKANVEDVAKAYDEVADSIIERAEGRLTDKDKATLEFLQKQASNMRSSPGEISGNRIKDFIQELDEVTEWDKGAGGKFKLDDIKKQEARGKLDSYLKSKSPAYQDMMKGVSSDTELLNRAQKVGGEKSLPNIFRRIETDKFGSGQAPKETIRQLDERMGTKFLEQIPESLAKETFDKSITSGSRNVNLWSNMMKDIPVVKYMAPLVGATVDKYGNKMTMGAVDLAAAFEKKMQSGDLAGYTRAVKNLTELVKNGDPAARLTFQLLQKRDPNLINLLNEKKEEN